MLGRRAAAAADDVDEAVARPVVQVAGHLVGALVVFAHGVGQSGVGIGEHETVGHVRDLGDVGAHQLGAERAIEADGKRLQVLDGEVERFGRLAGQRAAGTIRDGARDHQRQLDALLVVDLQDCVSGRLGVEGIEHGLDQEHVDAAVDEAPRLLGVCRYEFVEADVAEARIVDVGRDRRGAVGRAHGACNHLRVPRMAQHGGIGRIACEFRRGKVHLVGQVLHAVVRHGDALRVEGVGRDDVGAGLEVGLVNAADDVGLAQHEKVVVSFHGLVEVGKAGAPVGGLVQLVALDHRAHRTVDEQDPLLRLGLEKPDALLMVHDRAASFAAGAGDCALGRNPRRWQMANDRSARFCV